MAQTQTDKNERQQQTGKGDREQGGGRTGGGSKQEGGGRTGNRQESGGRTGGTQGRGEDRVEAVRNPDRRLEDPADDKLLRDAEEDRGNRRRDNA